MVTDDSHEPDDTDVLPDFGPEVVAIALFGSFNPAIFQPEWMVHHGIFRGEEVRPGPEHEPPMWSELYGDWFYLQVDQGRLLLSSRRENTQRLLATLRATFGILAHTPIEGAGIQRTFEVTYSSAAAAGEAFGRLAPADAWRDLGIDAARAQRTSSVDVETDRGSNRRVIVRHDGRNVLQVLSTEERFQHLEVVEGIEPVLDWIAEVSDVSERDAQAVVDALGESEGVK